MKVYHLPPLPSRNFCSPINLEPRRLRRRVYGFGTVPNSSSDSDVQHRRYDHCLPNRSATRRDYSERNPRVHLHRQRQQFLKYGCHLDEQLNIVIEDRFVDRCAHATVARIGHYHGDLSSRYHKVGFGDNQGCGPPVHFAGRAAPLAPRVEWYAPLLSGNGRVRLC